MTPAPSPAAPGPARTGSTSLMGRLAADTSDTRYRFVRRGMALVIGLRLAVGSYADLAGQPDSHFRPPGLLAWMDGVPSLTVLVVAQLVGIAAAVVAMSGRGVRVPWGASRARDRAGAVVAAWALPVAWASLLFLTAVRTSGGKVQHNDVLLLLAVVPLLLVPENRVRAGGGGVLVGARRNVGWPVSLAVAVIALAYWFSGVAKLVHTGPAWALSDNVRYVMYWAAQTPRPGIDWIPATLADHPGLARLVAVGALAFELAAPVIVFWPRSRLPYAMGAVALHLGTWAALGIDYWGWAATVVVVLVDWDRVGRAFRPGRGAPGTDQAGPGRSVEDRTISRRAGQAAAKPGWRGRVPT